MLTWLKFNFGVLGTLIFWVIMLAIIGGVLTTGAYLMKPVWLGFERQAFVASHQYVETQREAIIARHIEYISLSVRIKNADPEVKQGLIAQRATILVDMWRLASKIPADAVPSGVKSIIN